MKRGERIFFLIGFLGGLLSANLWGFVKKNSYKKLEVFAEVLGFIENEYAEPIDTEQLIYRAIEGMVSSLDRFSRFFRPKEFQELKKISSGEIGDPGFSVREQGKKFILWRVREGSSAARAGLKGGEIILKIGSRTVDGLEIREVIKLLRGEIGSEVRILLRTGEGKVKEVLLIREPIREKNLHFKLFSKGVLYVKIDSFREYTAEKLMERLLRLGGKLKGVILDLRGNPGGLFKQGVRVADLFLKRGTIVEIRGREPKKFERKVAHSRNSWPTIPIAVLVDRGTASASEVVAAALKDHRRAILIGERTFGKGSIQSIIELNDGSGLKLTVAHYYSPLGIKIDHRGISPHILETNPDRALQRALKFVLSPSEIRSIPSKK